MIQSHPRHPLGTKARVLLSSVFGPYTQDDEYGSRSINPMELYHNQVTRVQGGFSLRMFHRSFGLMLLQANIDAPCTLLDFPTQDRFIEEIKNHDYDIVGISSILPNIGKVKQMCELVRRYLPKATIVVGGHIANKDNIDDIIDANHIVHGDGVRWLRRYLGQDENAATRHPAVYSSFGTRAMGFTVPERPGGTAATLLPSVGCPMGCNFCCTSSMFGGKGKFINFYDTGDELFSVMAGLEKKLHVRSFFVLDENFLLHRKRALRLLELMEEHNKSWSLYVFSSGKVLKSYSIDQLVRLGVSWAWMGLEGEKSQYNKLRGLDTRELVKNLQSHGIRVLGSSIIGLETHDASNIDETIAYSVDHATDFHQFMLYTPCHGTPLYEEHRRAGTLLPESEMPLADIHGQRKFNFKHPRIHDGEESEFLLRAFRRDFEVNGPSLARVIRTTMQGWRRYKDHPDKRIRERFARESRSLPTLNAGLVWAARKWFKREPHIHEAMNKLLHDIQAVCGWKSKLAAPTFGRVLFHTLKKEEKRLREGWTYEPTAIYEKNAAAVALDRALRLRAMVPEIQWVAAEPAPATGGAT